MEYVMVFLVLMGIAAFSAVFTGCILAESYTFSFSGMQEREITVRKYGLNKHGDRCVFLWRPYHIFLPFCSTKVGTVAFPDAAAYETVKREGAAKFLAVYETKRFLFMTWDKYVGLKEIQGR